MFLLGGHAGPPLRQMARMGGNYPTLFVILMPHIWQKYPVFYGNAEESVSEPPRDVIVGADPCVRL